MKKWSKNFFWASWLKQKGVPLQKFSGRSGAVEAGRNRNISKFSKILVEIEISISKIFWVLLKSKFKIEIEIKIKISNFFISIFEIFYLVVKKVWTFKKVKFCLNFLWECLVLVFLCVNQSNSKIAYIKKMSKNLSRKKVLVNFWPKWSKILISNNNSKSEIRNRIRNRNRNFDFENILGI